MKQLDQNIHNHITKLSEQAEEYVEQEKFSQAIDLYNKALNLLPEPKEDWEAATFIYSALGDIYYYENKYDESYDAFQKSLKCPDALDNAFIQFRLGQLEFEKGRKEQAQDYFMRAYLLDGGDIFEGEDPKYMKLIEDEIKK